MVGIAVVIPLVAYVIGSLAAAQSEPARRPPIVLEVDPTDRPSPKPPRPTHPGDGPETVRPSPDDLDDDPDDDPGDPGDSDDSDEPPERETEDG